MARVLALVLAVGLAAGVAHLLTRDEAPTAAPAASTPATVIDPAQAPVTQAEAPAFDSARAWGHLQQIVAIGPRPSGSAALRQTRAYITRQIAGFGLTVHEQTFQAKTPLGQVEMVNLIVRLPGRRTDRILLTGHYDTKRYREFTFVGANDGGSSTAFLIELARVLKDRPREFTWEIVWFDGEEATCAGWDECSQPGAPDNTYGSRHYVEAARQAGALPTLKAMLLVDMIAEKNPRFLREADSTAWLKDIIWSAAKRLGYGEFFPDLETPITDDHVPFLQAGVPAVDIIDLDYHPYWHTAGDTLDKLAAGSLQIVGDVLLAALPEIEKRLMR